MLEKAYIDILKEELIAAMGCTEPIALAYAAAKAREVLGKMPNKVCVGASGSIIKNVKSVIVPNTNHLKGIEAAVAAGIVAGNADKELEVISDITQEEIEDINKFLELDAIEVGCIEDGCTFEIEILLRADDCSSYVRIANYHTNIVEIRKNDEVIYSRVSEKNFGKDTDIDEEDNLTDRSLLNMKDIYDFAMNVDISKVEDLIAKQIDYNMTIAEEGLKGDYGANIGKVLLKCEGDTVRVRAKAYAAAGSDARMNGCELPVIINSGSGNQGITCTCPVVVYARELGSSKEQLYRALILTNLTAIYQKTGIGRLSAYCGAVSAGAAAGAGITYLNGGGYKEVIHTVVNALAIVSGMVCDGAKASCAAKIAMSVDAGILGYEMYKCGQQFYSGDGIVAKGPDATIKNIGQLGKDGMKETNQTIINMMINK